jgi:hypothetical protein
MVPPYSDKVSRASPYSIHLACPFVYRAITYYGRHFQVVPLKHTRLNGLIPVRSPLLRESQLISVPTGTEMFHFPAFALQHYVFMLQFLPYGKWVPPFRHLRITGLLPPPRSFSQAHTSFIASDCQGIHHVHFITWLYNPKRSFIDVNFSSTHYIQSLLIEQLHSFNGYLTKTLDSVF